MTEAGKSTVGIVLPAYNEEGVIGQVITSLPRYINAGGKKYQTKIIVVNDGSRDATTPEVKKHDDVILIEHLLNGGAGAATRTGLHYAKGLGLEYAVTIDSDGQHSTKDLIRVTEEVAKDHADFVIGSRLKQYSGNMPLSKKIGNLGLSIITFLLLGVYVSDTQSGLKALNKKALDKIEFHSNGYAFCSEMIWKARQQKLRIKEIPIEAIYTDYSKSHGQKDITGAMDITKQLIKRRFLSFFNE